MVFRRALDDNVSVNRSPSHDCSSLAMHPSVSRNLHEPVLHGIQSKAWRLSSMPAFLYFDRL